ncbi:MAG TPA: hypothetical protein VN948_01780, partial [Terriglobales bacterium]|nr:hypothetical protein [Terriglobales bacterium]
MEGLAHLVAESLVRHGFETTFDHRRLQWSQWFGCQDSFSLVLAPCKPGLFALGEEVIAPGELAVGDGKRMLALFQISEAHDLGMALGRLFLSGSPERERLASGRCFARYVVIEDAAQRRSAHDALQRWMASSAEASTGIAQKPGPVSGLESQDLGSVSAHDSQKTGFESGHDSEKARFVSGHDFSRAASPARSTSALQFAEKYQVRQQNDLRQQVGNPQPGPNLENSLLATESPKMSFSAN